MLPRVLDEVRDAELAEVLRDHLEETRFHAARVESAFRAAGAEAVSARSAALAGAKEHHESQQATEPTLRDLLAAGAGVRAEHLELAVYQSLLGLAGRLGLDESAGLLEQSRGEEERALERLSGIAQRLRRELPG